MRSCSATDRQISLTKVVNLEKPLMYSEKIVFLINLEQMFKRTSADLDI
jgi:hypothetical protein